MGAWPGSGTWRTPKYPAPEGPDVKLLINAPARAVPSQSAGAARQNIGRHGRAPAAALRRAADRGEPFSTGGGLRPLLSLEAAASSGRERSERPVCGDGRARFSLLDRGTQSAWQGLGPWWVLAPTNASPWCRWSGCGPDFAGANPSARSHNQAEHQGTESMTQTADLQGGSPEESL
ncbi:hypothetical protein NDU88_002637 [Pleurodeles waltl]|uniref:C2H2-type domain-containing protein n=1 Tax=Pleurodeles waltl TaxID=8319 RepID=A0AAV7MS14_PLEWA|nr:hypothetical protein NDU88_002637 [Pleurodeles waltl]